MAKTRKINNALIRALDQSRSIVYLVSDQQTLIYANESCGRWLAADIESLIGTPFVYTSQQLPDPAQQAIKGLALPPDLFTSRESNSVSSFELEIFASSSNNLDNSSTTAENEPAPFQPETQSQSQSLHAVANAIYDHRGILSGFLVVANLPADQSADSNANSSREIDTRAAINEPAKLHRALAAVREWQQQRFSLKSFVGTSAAIDRVRRQATSAIESRSDVLIVGPPGSGREHLARTLIAESEPDDANASDSDANLIPLHCAITDPMQVQATMKELAGSIKRFAHSPTPHTAATLLLIEVDQLDRASQQEVLGYLQLPGFSVGTIATAGCNILNLHSDFDSQLANRLSTLTIELPSLSQRREDLPLLAQALLESGNEKNAKQFSGFTRQAIELICEYDWPQNLDQLAAAIEAAAAVATGNIIDVSDFPDSLHHAIQAQRFPAKLETKIQLDDYLLEIEQQLIERAVAQASGNKTKAAELLGVSRAKLLRRLQQFAAPESESQSEAETHADGLVDESVFREEPHDED